MSLPTRVLRPELVLPGRAARLLMAEPSLQTLNNESYRFINRNISWWINTEKIKYYSRQKPLERITTRQPVTGWIWWSPHRLHCTAFVTRFSFPPSPGLFASFATGLSTDTSSSRKPWIISFRVGLELPTKSRMFPIRALASLYHPFLWIL